MRNNRLAFAALIVLMILAGCGGCYQSQPYEYIQSPQGQNMVVVHDRSGDFLMEAAAFSILMNQGGYNNVIHHYHMYPSTYQRYNRATYSNWRTMPRNWSPGPSTINSNIRSTGSTPRVVNTSPGVRPSNIRSTYNTPRPSVVRTTPSYYRSSSSSQSSSSSSSNIRSSRRR